MEISIKGKDKAEVCAILYNNAMPLGMGMLHYDPTPWTAEDARRYLDAGVDDIGLPKFDGPLYLDYVKGRVVKVDLNRDVIDLRLFIRDNGGSAAARVRAQIEALPTVEEVAVGS